jgi:hypothetical protein
MASAINVNDMRVSDAAKYYASIGIITNPLYSILDKCTSPGKQPIPKAWQTIEKPYSNEAIDAKFKTDKNIGFLCGVRSNLTVIDRDWLRKGIWESIFSGIDTSTFVRVSHTKEKDHLLFKYCKELRAGQYKALGFDILSDDALIKNGKSYVAGDNCVCAPSLHKDGNRYQIRGNIEDRPEVPEAVVKRLSELIETSKYITKNVLPKCRPWFRKLWKALFELKDHELYHQTDIFYGDMENRVRCLHFCAELKANGADDNHLNIICMLLFGDRYNSEISNKEIRNINDKPATADTIKADPYFTRFYTETVSQEHEKKKMNRELSYEGAQARYEEQDAKYERWKNKSGENQLSNQARELLTLAFKKMLLSDDDNAKEKNGVGFNKFDSEAIHEEMDGKTEIPDETLIKFAHKLKKYKKQLTGFGIDTADIDDIIKEYNKKPKYAEPENIKVPFDTVAKEIMDNYHIFTTTDNKQMYLYQDGVYRNEGTEAILSTEIREIHDQLYAEYWISINQAFPLEHIPKATTKYISEVFAYIQDYTYKSRDEIDKEADRYLNFKNGIFDIEKWELEDHTPDYLSVCQIPRTYNPNAT